MTIVLFVYGWSVVNENLEFEKDERKRGAMWKYSDFSIVEEGNSGYNQDIKITALVASVGKPANSN